MGGAWASEAYNQSWLVLEALKMATDVLAPKGTFVTKIFRWVGGQRRRAASDPLRPSQRSTLPS